jgi:hypothetical protein
MRHFPQERWSHPSIALTLARIFPKGHERVSHETIYTDLRPARGELKRS